jgi:DNA-binding PadR family transcriptional regulator
MDQTLKHTEQIVMLAILRKHPNAYGVSICDELSSRAGIEPVLATIYNTLERLEKKGFVESRQGEATPERGGRAKMYFELTGLGHKALDASLHAIDRMRAGIVIKPVKVRA